MFCSFLVSSCKFPRIPPLGEGGESRFLPAPAIWIPGECTPLLPLSAPPPPLSCPRTIGRPIKSLAYTPPTNQISILHSADQSNLWPTLRRPIKSLAYTPLTNQISSLLYADQSNLWPSHRRPIKSLAYTTAKLRKLHF